MSNEKVPSFKDAKKTDESGKQQPGELLKFERKDVWDMKWASVRSSSQNRGYTHNWFLFKMPMV